MTLILLAWRHTGSRPQEGTAYGSPSQLHKFQKNLPLAKQPGPESLTSWDGLTLGFSLCILGEDFSAGTWNKPSCFWKHAYRVSSQSMPNCFTYHCKLRRLLCPMANLDASCACWVVIFQMVLGEMEPRLLAHIVPLSYACSLSYIAISI